MRRLPDLLLVVETLLIMVRSRVVIRRAGLPGALAAYHLQPVDDTCADREHGRWTERSRRTARIAGLVLEAPGVRSTCLPTALSLAEVLRRHGLDGDVVIGVSAAQGFSAHAWVELPEGRIDLAGHPLSAHREISRFRRASGARS